MALESVNEGVEMREMVIEIVVIVAAETVSVIIIMIHKVILIVDVVEGGARNIQNTKIFLQNVRTIGRDNHLD